jgi:hypothetical protein
MVLDLNVEDACELSQEALKVWRAAGTPLRKYLRQQDGLRLLTEVFRPTPSSDPSDSTSAVDDQVGLFVHASSLSAVFEAGQNREGCRRGQTSV